MPVVMGGPSLTPSLPFHCLSFTLPYLKDHDTLRASRREGKVPRAGIIWHFLGLVPPLQFPGAHGPSRSQTLKLSDTK